MTPNCCYMCADCHLYPNDDLFCDCGEMHRPLVTGLCRPDWCPKREEEEDRHDR